jgi:hypothetical protein
MKFSFMTVMAFCPGLTPREFYEAFRPTQESSRAGIRCLQRKAHNCGFGQMICSNEEDAPERFEISSASMKGVFCGIINATVHCFKSGKVRVNTSLTGSVELCELSSAAVDEFIEGIFNCLHYTFDKDFVDSRIINFQGIHKLSFGIFDDTLRTHLVRSEKCKRIIAPEPNMSNHARAVRLLGHEDVYFRINCASGVVQAFGAKTLDNLDRAWEALFMLLLTMPVKRTLVPKPPKAPKSDVPRPRGRPRKQPISQAV